MRRILILLVLLLVASAGLVTTGAGLRLASRIAVPLLPGLVTYETLEGRLIGPLKITHLTWQQDEQRLSIERIDLDWHPGKLLSRHLHIERFEASGVHWQAPASTDTAETGTSPVGLPQLPVTITAGKLQIDDILIEHGTLNRFLASVQLAGQLDKQRYRIETLAVRSDELDVDGAATIGVPSPHEIDIDLQWTVRPKDQNISIQGRTSGKGNSDELAIQLHAGGPFDLALTGTALKLLDEPRIDGQLELENFDPAVIGIETRTGLLSTTLDYAVARDGIGLNGRLHAPELLPAAAVIMADIGLEAEVVKLRQVKAQLENMTMTVAASGTVQTDLSDLDLELGWTDLAWPPGDEPTFSSPRGGANLTGSKDRYRLRLNGTTEKGLAPATSFTLSGKGTMSSFDFDDLSVSFEQGQLSGHGMLDWSGTPTARLELDSENLDLSQWHAELDGRIGFDSAVVASLPDDGARVSVELRKVQGRLQDKTLTGAGSFDYAPGMIHLRKIDLRAGRARIRANGQIGAEVALEWNVSVPDLGLFIPAGSGSVRSQGKASGPRQSPGLIGDLVATGVKAGTFSAARVDGSFEIGMTADATASVDLRAADVAIGAVSLNAVKSQTDGAVAQHSISLEIDGPAGKLDADFLGGVTDGGWQGRITKLVASREDIGAWQIDEAAPLGIFSDRVELGQTCLVQAGAKLCAGGNTGGSHPWRTEFQLTDLPLALPGSLLPTDLLYEGAISGQGHIASADAGWAGNASLQLGDGRVLTRENDNDDILIAYQDGLVETTFDPAGIRAKLKLDLRDDGLVDADVTVPTDAGQALSGQVQARLENLSIVTALVPQIGRIDGRLDTNLVLAGTLGSPDLSGQIALQTTEIVLPDLGITLADTVVNVMTQGNDLRFDGSAASGEGRLALSGDLRWQQGSPRGQLKIEGDKFRAVDLPEIRLDASPVVTLAVDGRDIGIEGSITVPAAQITPIDIGGGISVSPDQEIIGQAAEPEEKDPWRIKGNIQVTAGDSVHIKGYGLEGRLAGSVLVIEAPNQPTIGRGALEIVDGRYRAYGQKLTIETGRLTFTGGQIDDPGLNLLATRTAGNVVAGAQVRGALRAPVLTLYSVPAMSDAQAMSYLITGRGLEELNEVDQTAVNETAARLALRGGSFLASSLGRELGLDTVEFKDAGEVASTELVVGKHLSPRLYISYGIGLFEAINTVRLRYRINSRLTLETQSGTRTSADLLYGIEK